MNVKTISVLGSTGSIGTQTLEVARHLGLKITALSANSSVRLLESQCREFLPETVCIGEAHYTELKTALADTDIKVVCGDDALAALAYEDKSETLVNAVLGMKGLRPTLAAAKAGKKIAFANKETLVAGGTLVTEAVRDGNAELLPVDSEHSAIFQCLRGARGRELKKILLTGSGGPFRGKDTAFLETVTPEMAVKHPKWNMGKKISVDSASLMNKGLELIEAMHLFSVRPEQIEILIHPQARCIRWWSSRITLCSHSSARRICASAYSTRSPIRAGALRLPRSSIFSAKSFASNTRTKRPSRCWRWQSKPQSRAVTFPPR